MNDPDENPFAPFKITFMDHPSDASPLDFEVISCENSYVSFPSRMEDGGLKR